MGLFDGIAKVFTNPANLLAIATMNPALIAATVGRQLVSAIGQEVIQSLGKELGLPQSVIDMAQGAFASSMGDVRGAQQNYREAAQGVMNDFFNDFNVRPQDRGTIERQANSLRDLISQMFRDALQSFSEEQDNARGRSANGGRGDGRASAAGGEGLAGLGIEGGFLVEFAAALGTAMDNKMEDMMKLAGKINEEGQREIDTEDTNALTERQSNIQVYSSVLQGLSQELNVLSQAMANAVKSAGEAQASVARKG